ncbi:MAG: hypothetical protein QME75_13555 [Deltaproteobacteria bacterium]|nr:hypothetical protein [Desulfitobacteriaceae bacterium]MDI6854618.1 hypothetical protein [Deltaproteobacteria bacterium]
MDKAEAGVLLEEFLQELKARSYRELQEFIRNPVCFERTGPSGAVYQIEYEAVWDAEPGGDLRIIASIDDGGLLSAMMPVSSGFIVTPQEKIT